MISVRRIYDQPASDEGYKVLVDRLWPWGISKEKAGCNEWMKDVAPSNKLRIWYFHDHSKWKEFKKLYRKELLEKSEALARLKEMERQYGTITLLYSSTERELNNAVALKEFLAEQDK